jgi:hypothetical protein
MYLPNRNSESEYLKSFTIIKSEKFFTSEIVRILPSQGDDKTSGDGFSIGLLFSYKN